MNLPPSAIDSFHQGSAHLAARRLAEAEAAFRQAVNEAPAFAEAQANLALALEWQGKQDEAETAYRAALQANPAVARTHLNFGALLARRGRFDEAEASYRQAIALAPQVPAGWSNLGVLYASIKREEEAEQCHRTALTLDPDYASARFNLAYLLLRQGRFPEGWTALEARDWYAPLAGLLACPRWQGEPLSRKSLLIGCEAGHGDMIQFVRYPPMLKALGAARVAILCHPGLAPLFATAPGIDQAIPLDQPLPSWEWDCWVPPLSLPGLFNTTLSSIPATLPYLFPDPARVAALAGRLPREGLRVGLVWRGNPNFENDADRSLPGLASLQALASVPGIRFVSLQKGTGEDEAENPPMDFPVLNGAPMLNDFADTAALITGLDLVITVDTAVAHLTGALGKPCWILLPWYQTDWRWLDGRDDSPWYPHVVRLFRQTARGEWAPVVERIAAALAEFVA